MCFVSKLVLHYFSCGETCSHVASILFKVEAYHRLEIAKQTCTSLPCLWNQASTKNVSCFIEL